MVECDAFSRGRGGGWEVLLLRRGVARSRWVCGSILKVVSLIIKLVK